MLGRKPNNERSDRAVRRVLWVSMAIFLVPIAALLSFVQPALNRLAPAHEANIFHSELAAGGRASLGDSLLTMASRAAHSGFNFVVGAGQGGEESEEEPEDDEAPRRFSVFFDAGVLAERPLECPLVEGPAGVSRTAGCVWLRPAVDETRPTVTPQSDAEASVPRRAIGLIAELQGGGTRSPVAAPMTPVVRLDALGGLSHPRPSVFAADLGGASLTVSGALDGDDFSALRPIEAAGVGSYLSDAPEFHHGVVSGRAAATFAEGRFSGGRWRLRPEIDLGAEYLALDKVRLDAGEAGLFLPETEEWVFSARPSLAVEGEIAGINGVRIVPHMRAGATWLSQTDFIYAATMLDTPTLSGFLSTTQTPEDVFADFEAGLGLAGGEGLLLSVRYGGMFGQAFENHTGQLELSMQF